MGAIDALTMYSKLLKLFGVKILRRVIVQILKNLLFLCFIGSQIMIYFINLFIYTVNFLFKLFFRNRFLINSNIIFNMLCYQILSSLLSNIVHLLPIF